MVACHIEASCLFQAFLGEQHPWGKIPKLLLGFRAQGQLIHHRVNPLDGV